MNHRFALRSFLIHSKDLIVFSNYYLIILIFYIKIFLVRVKEHLSSTKLVGCDAGCVCSIAYAIVGHFVTTKNSLPVGLVAWLRFYWIDLA